MRVRSLFRVLLAPLLPVLLALGGCAQTATQGPSALDRTLEGLSFEVPQAPELGERERAAGGGPPTAQETRPQVFLGQKVSPPPRPGGAPVRRTPEGIQLNLQDADITEVAKVILGDILGVNFTIDPKVQGTVTIASARPLAERDLLGLLETVLRMNGAALVDLGGSYAVVPAERAIGRSEVVPLGGEPPLLRRGFGVAVVPLRFISAPTAANLIQPLVSRPEDIRIDEGRNILIIAADGIERQYVVDTLTSLDVDWMAGRSVGLFPLKRSTPEAIIPELEAVLLPPRIAGEEPLIRFLPVKRLNAVLAIGSDPQQIVRVETWVGRLDRGNTVGVQFYVYEVKNVPAEEMAKLLNAALADIEKLEAAGSVVAAAPPEAGPVEAGPAERPDTALAGETPAAAGTGTAKAGLLRTVKIVADKATNKLLIRATPQIYDMIEATLRRLDRPALQVLIEATIVEVLLTDQLRYGVQYFLDTANLRAGFNTTGPAGTVPKTGLEPLGLLPGFNFIYTGANANITIQALSKITKLRVLSSPSVVVENNREARLNVGDDVPVVTRSSVSVTDPNAPIVNNVEYRSTGVILSVKPRINSEGVVSLSISQEVSRLATTGVQTLNNNPVIQQRKIASRVNVRSGQTVVLGGLIQDNDTRNKEKVPLLGDIPVLGELFSSTNNTTARTELLVFITPRVVRNAEDARAVSEELRSRMRAFAPPKTPKPSEKAPEPPPPSHPLLPSGSVPAAPDPAPTVQAPTEDPVSAPVAEAGVANAAALQPAIVEEPIAARAEPASWQGLRVATVDVRPPRYRHKPGRAFRPVMRPDALAASF